MYYVDKSVDRSSSSRALCFCLCFYPSLIPKLPEKPPNFSTNTGSTWEDGARSSARGSGSRIRSVLHPSPLRRREGMFQSRTISPVRTTVASTAGGWREGGRSRGPRPARPRRTRNALGAVARARGPARGERLGFCSLSCFTDANWNIIFLVYCQRNEARPVLPPS